MQVIITGGTGPIGGGTTVEAGSAGRGGGALELRGGDATSTGSGGQLALSSGTGPDGSGKNCWPLAALAGVVERDGRVVALLLQRLDLPVRGALDGWGRVERGMGASS